MDLPHLINEYYRARSDRLEKEREAEKLKSAETKLKDSIIRLMREQGILTLGASLATVKLQPKEKPQVQNWESLYDYILVTKEFDLLQRRLTETAVKLRWDEGKDVPGVIKYPIDELSISK
jgi:hypothetical protein